MPRGENRATAVSVGWPCVIPLFAKLQLSNSERTWNSGARERWDTRSYCSQLSERWRNA